MKKAVFAIARNFNQANTLVRRLQETGFPRTHISLLAPDTGGERDLGKGKMPEAAASHGQIGGFLGSLAGISTVAVPGVGPFIAAGPIRGVLGERENGNPEGDFASGLIGLGVPDFEASLYADKLKQGHYLLSVHEIDGREVEKARETFKNSGTEDFCVTDERAA